ncbi:hypothetical protein BASA61_009495 [Batrachochytrium salamandrivorans]|nr:hypothetical protein BASA61_009495 [Batrachochytrium salamandrivorans]KAH6583824.1 hypothetical protein BASA60_001241 [Batrachochytrium salamandrivorans]
MHTITAMAVLAMVASTSAATTPGSAIDAESGPSISRLLGLAAPITASAESSSNTEHSRPHWSQHKAVAAFDSLISKRNVKDTLEFLTSRSHIAGSDNDHEYASYIQKRWQEAGLPSTHIKSYYPLLNFPIARSLSLLEPKHYDALLSEPVVPEDKSSTHPEDIPTFLGFSPSGNVTAELVYANFGDPQDFDALASNGIDVKGKIVLVRYGASFRGLKVRAAELAGAAAVLIYSDPAQDGFKKGAVYPEGPWRPPHSVQRGSVQYPSFYSGDPLTPFIAATKDAPRISMEDANIPKIPALPISYADATPFLEALVGHGVNVNTISKSWQGGLDLDYWTGPAGKVHLYVNNEFKITPIWNVLSIIEGEKEPDQAIILGGHNDAWVYGAVDPSSSSAVIIETGVALGKMYKSGWRPDRTIILASWDAEEYGLLGSCEWVEDHVEILNKTAIAYINVDMGVFGTQFEASASPSLSNFIRDVTKGIKDPSSGNSVYKQWNQQQGIDSPQGRVPRIDPLGFGSDFVAFLQHIGVAALDVKFSGDYGVYHSNYDSFHWMEKFGDPTWEYHKTLSSILGHMLLKLAHDEVLPFDYVPYTYALELYSNDVDHALKAANRSVEWADELHQAIGLFSKAVQKLDKVMEKISKNRIATDSVSVVNPLVVQDPASDMFLMLPLASQPENTETVLKSTQQLTAEDILAYSKHLPTIKEINHILGFGERAFIDMNGIPGRPWYRHVVYAPGEWTGYAAEMFPSIHEGLRAQNDEAVRLAISTIARQIRGAAEFLTPKE